MPSQFASGIYKIEHRDSSRCYIGSSNNIEVRWQKHIQALKRGTHHSKYMQRVWDKYGSEAFVFSVLLICSVDMLKEYEQVCLDGLKPKFNGTSSANSPVHRGQKLPPDWVAKVSASVQARYANGFKVVHPPRSESFRSRVSAQSKQRWEDPVIREKTTLAIQQSMTPEECIKKSERVKKLWENPEYRQKAIASRKGKAYNKGYKCTPDQIQNRKKAARISNMKRNYGESWKEEYVKRYPEFSGDVYA
jgi:group I intron endonuclease